MIRHKLNRRFLPHYFVHASLVENHPEPHKLHHRAHAITTPALFAYLQILIILAAGLFLIKVHAAQILGTASFGSREIVALTNQERAEAGLPPVSINNSLGRAAAAKASDMFNHDYWAHNSPFGRTPWSFIADAGYKYTYAGENLARDFSEAPSVVDAWMDSPTHRSNILDKNFKEIGVAVVSGKLGGKEGVLVVQMFGTGISQIPLTRPLAGQGQTSLESQTKGSSEQASEQVTVLGSAKQDVARGVSLALVGFIFSLFALEALVSLRRANVYVASGVLAHLGLLAFVLFAVWYAASGAVI